MTGSMRHGAKKDHQGDSGRAGYGPRDGGGGARKKMDTSAGTLCVVLPTPLLFNCFIASFQQHSNLYPASVRWGGIGIRCIDFVFWTSQCVYSKALVSWHHTVPYPY